MTPRNLSLRAPRHATAGVRTVAIRRAAATLTMALVALLSTVSADATTRTTRPKARPVAQTQAPAPAAPKSAKKAKPAAKPAAKAAKAKPKTKAKPKQEPVDDPIEMRRASHRKVSTKQPREVASRHSEPLESAAARRRHTGETNLAAERMPAPMTPVTRHKVAPAKSQSTYVAPTPSAADMVAASDAANRAATMDDIVRAAAAYHNGEVFAAGTSHPDDDERLPMSAQASVSANDAEPKAAPAPRRVSGFGAEGDTPAPQHRTLAQTMSKHHNATPPVEAPSAAEQEQITEEAVQPMVLPAIYTRGGRLMMPAPLKGTHEILIHQNTMADSEGLDRIQDDEDLNRMVAARLLVRLPESASLRVNEDLPANRRYARPWTVKFVIDTARAFEHKFGVPLQVNSAVRTVAYQIRLMRTNGNAAPPEGATASPHLTGQAIDFGKRGMSATEIAWMRAYLLPIMKSGKIDVEEEFQQACFHISVYRSYAPVPKKMLKTEVAQVRKPVLPVVDGPLAGGGEN